MPQPSDNNAKLGVPTVQCRYVSRIAGHCRLSNERKRMGHPSNHGSTHGIRTVRSKRDADFIFAGKAQPVVHSGVRGRMCAGIDLRLSPRRVAIRSRGSRVVSGRASPLVRHGELEGGVISATLAFANDATKELDSAAVVIRNMTSSHQIPSAVLENAESIAVIPAVKQAALIVGGKHGDGVASCRTRTSWSAPKSRRNNCG